MGLISSLKSALFPTSDETRLAVVSASQKSYLAESLRIPEPTRSLVWITDKDPSLAESPLSTTLTISLTEDCVTSEVKEMGFYAEPSLIWTKLAVRPNNKLETQAMYWPRYAAFDPEHRYQYLNWLRDITQPTNLSYVFLYFYGLERHLLIGDYDNAVDEIIRLMKNHTKQSFISHSTTSLIVASIAKNRIDIVERAPSIIKEEVDEALIMRMMLGSPITSEDVISKPAIGTFKEYPLKTTKGTISWPGKFPTDEDIELEQQKIGDEKAWQREYMLKIIADEDQLVHQDWVQYYDQLPTEREGYEHSLMGVDLAISTSDQADYTAMVVGHIFRYEETLRIYIQKFPINQRLDFPSAIETIKKSSTESGLFDKRCKIYIEDVGYQRAVIQQLCRQGLDTEGFQVSGQDKRARLDSVTYMIRSGNVLFPKEGAEDLIQQLVYFGVEKHDDLVDAFTIVLHMAIKRDRGPVQVLPREIYNQITYGSSYKPNYWAGENPML